MGVEGVDFMTGGSSGGGGGGAPSGPAGGALAGTYPNPALGAGIITDTNVAAAAAIARSKLGPLSIADADIIAGANIAKSKLAALGIVDADVAAGAGIAKSKLAALGIVDADVAAGAGIAKSKLAALAITDGDVAAAAGIALSKLASGEMTATDYKTTGLTGAVSGLRIVGANASGAPTTGTWVVGDLAAGLDGHLFLCTVAGTPGTWVDIGASAGTVSQLTNGSSRLVIGPTGNLTEFGGSAPTLTAFNGSTGLALDAGSSDLRGGVTLTSGTPGAGVILCRLTFATSFTTNAPIVLIVGRNVVSAGTFTLFPTGVNIAQFDVAPAFSITAATAISFAYHVIG